MRILGKEVPKVVPFRRVAVDRPALAQFRHGEPVEELLLRAVDVGVDLRLGIDRGRHLDGITMQYLDNEVY
jgi:hypothetical protein